MPQVYLKAIFKRYAKRVIIKKTQIKKPQKTYSSESKFIASFCSMPNLSKKKNNNEKNQLELIHRVIYGIHFSPNIYFQNGTLMKKKMMAKSFDIEINT